MTSQWRDSIVFLTCVRFLQRPFCMPISRHEGGIPLTWPRGIFDKGAGELQVTPRQARYYVTRALRKPQPGEYGRAIYAAILSRRRINLFIDMKIYLCHE